MNFPRPVLPLLLCIAVLLPRAARAQVDPEKRQLFQLGYNQSLQGRGPVAADAYYYLNLPDWPREGQTLRLEVGDRVLAIETEQGVLFTPYDPDVEEGLVAAARAAKKFRNALRELAK